MPPHGRTDGKAVEHGGGHLRIAEHGRPLSERQVRGDDHRGAFVKFADEVEQQLAVGTGERQVTELVEHDDVEPRELGCQGPGLADPGLRVEQVHNKADLRPNLHCMAAIKARSIRCVLLFF